jgi:radical SAM superfamily enzyme YgiQ (UPF0313 family)
MGGPLKIVLFRPHSEAGSYLTYQRLPLDILSISGFPAQHGYQVVIVDATVQPDYRERVLQECRDALCFGTTSKFGYPVYHASQMMKEVQEIYPSLPIVAGGWFPSVRPDMVFREGAADIAVLRQGELTFMELVSALETGASLKGIEGIAYRENGEIVFNSLRKIEDMNRMPSMPYHLIDLERYFASDPNDRAKRFIYATTGKDISTKKIRSLDYFSSYGCPDNCAFCTSPGVTERNWTALEADRVVDELDHLVREYHLNMLIFLDANWGVSEERAFKISEGILERGIEVFWAASIEARTLNDFDREVVRTMARSGCVVLFIGGESSDSVTLDSIGKNIRPGDVFLACQTCSEVGIAPLVFFAIGFPDETRGSIQSTIEDGCEILYRWPEAEVPIVLFAPLPGTPFYDRAVQLGMPPIENIEYWSSYKRFGSELYNPAMRPRPDLYSGITEKQMKTLRRCQRYYFWWGVDRMKDRRKLSIPEKILYQTSRLRLKYKILGFPIEYKLYYLYRRFREVVFRRSWWRIVSGYARRGWKFSRIR